MPNFDVLIDHLEQLEQQHQQLLKDSDFQKHFAQQINQSLQALLALNKLTPKEHEHAFT